MVTSSSFPFRFVALYLAFGACDSSKVRDSATSSSPDSASLAPARDTANAANTVGSSSNPGYLDSADVFNPDGYYFVKEEVQVGDRKVSWVELHTIDYYYGGKLHYERPKLAQPPEIVLSITIPGRAKHSMNRCADALVTRDSLSARCVVPPRSEVTINGHFLDKRGQYSDKIAYETTPTVLLEARVVVTGDGKVSHDAIHHFTYSGGG